MRTLVLRGSSRLETFVDTVADDEWDHLLTGFTDVALEQSARYTALFAPDKRVSHILLRNNNKIIGGARLVIYNAGFGRGIAYCRLGPFWRPLDQPTDPARYRLLLHALRTEYCDRRGHLLTILPATRPDIYTLQTQTLEEAGFQARRPVMHARQYYVDATLDEAARTASLGQKWRYNLRAARQHKWEFRIGYTPADVTLFCEMHARMVARKSGFDDQDRIDILMPLLRLPEALRPSIAIASYEDRPVCSAAICIQGDTGVYAFGASEDAALPLKAGYALHWWILGWMHDRGLRWYRLGSDAVGNAGLQQFKTGMIGKTGHIITQTGEYDVWASARSRMIGDAIYRSRDIRRVTRVKLANLRRKAQ